MRLLAEVREQGTGNREQGTERRIEALSLKNSLFLTFAGGLWKMKSLDIDIILVPGGAEYRAVCRGLQGINAKTPLILPIPMGINALTPYLEKLLQTEDFLNKSTVRILLMGLCGSLSPQYGVGDLVIYQACTDRIDKLSWKNCDRDLSVSLYALLQGRASLVKGLTSDRVICSSQEKVDLGRTCQADVVDMEGYAVLEVFQQVGMEVAILRVISDDSQQNLPDLTSAISSDGFLKPVATAIAMLQNPLAAMQLIRGSLRGLQKLEKEVGAIIQN
jgi:purine-nucleoside phosphorylase